MQRVGCGRIRHLQLKHLWVQELIKSDRVSVQWIPRAENCADILTHPTGVADFDRGLAGMGVCRSGRADKTVEQSVRGGVLGSRDPNLCMIDSVPVRCLASRFTFIGSP